MTFGSDPLVPSKSGSFDRPNRASQPALLIAGVHLDCAPRTTGRYSVIRWLNDLQEN
jgi:hypothetical protein